MNGRGKTLLRLTKPSASCKPPYKGFSEQALRELPLRASDHPRPATAIIVCSCHDGRLVRIVGRPPPR
jgi:hypothetical protein